MLKKEIDIVIIGGGTGGCAAALAAARSGKRVVMTEETDWIGGQLTQQAVPPDEHEWIESFGGTHAYRTYRTKVREYYRSNFPLTDAARSKWDLNPGNGTVSRLCHDFRAGLAVLNEMLAPYTTSGQIEILLNTKAVSADAEGDRIRSVDVESTGTGKRRTLSAPYILDATELGDLLPMSGTEYVTGFESQSDTGEPHAPSEAQPDNMQAISFTFAIDYLPGEDHTIERPDMYDFWNAHTPDRTPAWPNKLLHWTHTQPRSLEPFHRLFDPVNEDVETNRGYWTFRRILHKENFVDGAFRSDICLVNWPQIDYCLGNLNDVSDEEYAKHIYQAKQQSLSLFYWMQTEAPRPDGGVGWKGLRLRPDLVGTDDGLAKYPYIRESRRIKAEFTVLEQHIGTDARMEITGQPREEIRAESFHDSIGLGSYRIDLHPSTGGDNYIDISSLPFEIPLGSLVPVRMENLLPACKNLGVTHITNGCYRLHPVEWNIGESAGCLAAFCLDRKKAPRQVLKDQGLLEDFQAWIGAQGIEIRWPTITPR